MQVLDHYYTVAQASQELKISKQQVINRIRRKQIKAEKMGWFWVIPKTEINKPAVK